MNVPDQWVVLEFVISKQTIQKVFAGWRGGYLHGDSWRLNSGIVETKEFDDYWDFHGASGSVYRCRKDGYGMTTYMAQIYNSFLASLSDDMTMTVLEEYK